MSLPGRHHDSRYFIIVRAKARRFERRWQAGNSKEFVMAAVYECMSLRVRAYKSHSFEYTTFYIIVIFHFVFTISIIEYLYCLLFFLLS